MGNEGKESLTNFFIQYGIISSMLFASIIGAFMLNWNKDGVEITASLLIVFIEGFAVFQDIRDKMVSDIIHIMAFLVVAIADVILINVYHRPFFSTDLSLYLVPLTFIFFTIKTRGLSDTMFMAVILSHCVVFNIPVIILLLGLLLAYVIMAIQRGVSHAKKDDKLAFIPAILMGFLFICSYHIIMKDLVEITMVMIVAGISIFLYFCFYKNYIRRIEEEQSPLKYL